MSTGQRFADRYELLEEATRASGGRVFRGRDIANSEVVALKPLETGGTGASGMHRFAYELRRVQSATHPALLRHDAVLQAERLLVREWLHGFSLLELLRWRKHLTASETLQVLPNLPATLDFLVAEGLALPKQLLPKILIGFDPSIDPKEVASLPLAQWPSYQLKVNPLSVRASLASVEGQTTLTTVTDLHSSRPETSEEAAFCFANLLYELLGGHVRSTRETRYSPVAALREEGNAVLRCALAQLRYPDCQTLWSELERAQRWLPSPVARVVGIPRSKLVARIPVTLLRDTPPSTALRLVPQDAANSAIHLVSRNSFAIGRSLVQADCVTRFFPESPENLEQTGQLSRVHALAEATEGRITIRDGNGVLASVNGSSLDGEPLDAERATILRGRSMLNLGEMYDVEIVPALSKGSRSLEITNLDEAPRASIRSPGGFVLFLPAEGQPVLRHAIWLFSEIGFGLDFARRIVWDTRPYGESRAMFHHDRGGFWLRNATLPDGIIEIEGTSLAHDEIAPLVAEQTVRIGTLHFTVELA